MSKKNSIDGENLKAIPFNSNGNSYEPKYSLSTKQAVEIVKYFKNESLIS